MERFWAKVDVRGPDDCWEWQASRVVSGYGQIAVAGRPRRAHRVAWELTNGPVPRGFFVCHTCDNPPCCNPAHLFVGTPADNQHDRRAKGRNHDTGARQPANGSRLPQTKLSDGQVVEIRSRYAAGGISQRALAREYGVTQPAISLVVTRSNRSSVV